MVLLNGLGVDSVHLHICSSELVVLVIQSKQNKLIKSVDCSGSTVRRGYLAQLRVLTGDGIPHNRGRYPKHRLEVESASSQIEFTCRHSR